LVGKFDLARAAKLKAKWRISIAAIVKRAADLGVIGPGKYRSMFTQLSMLGYRRREPEYTDVPVERPTLLKRRLSEYRESHSVSDEQLREQFGVLQQDYIGELCDAT